jgi:hypothetical protein
MLLNVLIASAAAKVDASTLRRKPRNVGAATPNAEANTRVALALSDDCDWKKTSTAATMHASSIISEDIHRMTSAEAHRRFDGLGVWDSSSESSTSFMTLLAIIPVTL